jgi:hypothetical protein
MPENGLTWHVSVDYPVRLEGHVFAIYRVEGERAREVEGVLPKWAWDEGRRIARLQPATLQKGAPHLLVCEGMVLDDGTIIPEFAVPFRVIGPDHEPPDGRGLRVYGDPQPGTFAALRLPFPEPVREDARRRVGALAGGKPWPGSWTLVDDQRTLEFVPAQPWPTDLVVVSVGAGIQDLAFNDMIDRPEEMLVPQVPVGREGRP